MEIEEALRTHLKTTISTPITPDTFNGLPAITYIKISDIKDHTLEGQSKLERPMIQFTVYASGKSDARTTANKIKTALCDFQGTLSGIFVQKIELQNEISSYEDSIKAHTEDLEFQIFYERK